MATDQAAIIAALADMPSNPEAADAECLVAYILDNGMSDDIAERTIAARLESEGCPAREDWPNVGGDEDAWGEARRAYYAEKRRVVERVKEIAVAEWARIGEESNPAALRYFVWRMAWDTNPCTYWIGKRGNTKGG
jgi:hypothetical protein